MFRLPLSKFRRESSSILKIKNKQITFDKSKIYLNLKPQPPNLKKETFYGIIFHITNDQFSNQTDGQTL